MAKYTYEFKKNVVKEYLDGKGEYKALAKKYGIPKSSLVACWVAAYKAFGDKGLRCSKKHKNYSFEFKLYMVKLYLSSKISYQEIALKNGMNNPSLVSKWVSKFRTGGLEALRFKRGCKEILDKKHKSIYKKKPAVSIGQEGSTESIQQLKDELLKLRIENAYLKELRRLRLQAEALLKKQRESYTAPEENSN